MITKGQVVEAHHLKEGKPTNEWVAVRVKEVGYDGKTGEVLRARVTRLPESKRGRHVWVQAQYLREITPVLPKQAKRITDAEGLSNGT